MLTDFELHTFFIVFLCALGISLFYHLYFYLRFVFYESKLTTDKPKPLSVIVAARNEEENLRENLPHIFNQKGLDFEVVVVNDRSEDFTSEVLRQFAARNLKVVNIKPNAKNTARGKKLAVTLGVKAAKYDNLVFIDADCKPTSDQWLLYMAQALMRKPIVLGVSPFEDESGFWKKFFAADALMIAIRYVSFALGGFPYMGVGRNMGYHKDVFFKAGGFRNHVHLASGDDDLFVNEAAHRKNVEIVLHPDAFTVSKSKDTLKKWINQKLRHVSTAHKYRVLHKVLLILLPLSQYIAFGLFIVLLLLKINAVLTAVVFSLGFITQQIVVFLCLKRTKAIKNRAWSLAYVITQPFVYSLVLFKKEKRRFELWKQV